MWSRIMDDYKKTPKLIKRLGLALVLVACTCTGLIVSCGVVTPSKEYTLRVEERADLHFPRYKALIDSATPEELEKLTGEEPGTYKNLSPSALASYKAQLKREIDSFHEYIKSNAKLIRDLQKDKGGKSNE